MPPTTHHHLDRDAVERIEQLVREALRRQEEEEKTPPEPHALLCAACDHPVTDERLRIRVQGAHRHHCVNPLGVTFDVSCFSEAGGALALGNPDSDHSWFPGHQWRYALCGGCGEHLGWHYSGIDEFFGLIEEKLKRPPNGS